MWASADQTTFLGGLLFWKESKTQYVLPFVIFTSGEELYDAGNVAEVVCIDFSGYAVEAMEARRGIRKNFTLLRLFFSLFLCAATCLVRFLMILSKIGCSGEKGEAWTFGFHVFPTWIPPVSLFLVSCFILRRVLFLPSQIVCSKKIAHRL